MPTLYVAALIAQSQEIPLGEAAVSGTVLGQVGTGLHDVYPDMESPVKDGCEATLRKLFEEKFNWK